MPKEKNNKPKSAFVLALAARRKEIPEESLSGAARLLFRDESLTQAALEDYTKAKPVVPEKQFIKSNVKFKGD